MKAAEVVQIFASFPPDMEVSIDWVRRETLDYYSDLLDRPRVTDEQWERYVAEFDGNIIEPPNELNIILDYLEV